MTMENGTNILSDAENHKSADPEGGIEILTDNLPQKRQLQDVASDDADRDSKRQKGTAPIKEEYLILRKSGETLEPQPGHSEADDDAAEAFHHKDRQPAGNNTKAQRKRNQGQNKARNFGSSEDQIGLCSTRMTKPEFSPSECPFGNKCRFEHDLRKYLNEHKRSDLATFEGQCPVWEMRGKCNVGWKCRFVGSHSKEIKHDDGRMELVLIEDEAKINKTQSEQASESNEADVVNNIDTKDKMMLTKKKFPTPKSDKYLPWLDATQGRPEQQGRKQQQQQQQQQQTNGKQENGRNSSSPEPGSDQRNENRASYVEAPLLPSEKRRLYFGPDTPVLAPLTTQGNLPFRQLCSSLGASFTYSEMAMSMPLLSGQKSEWALLKAHRSEVESPMFVSNDRIRPLQQTRNIVYDYDQSADLRFGAQIAANKPWLAIKTTEALTALLPDRSLRVIDVNCGCPIDLVFREGAGSALMDSPNKLDKMLRGMNVVSGSVPITCKIRTGTRDKQPTAQKLVERLVLGAKRDGGRYDSKSNEYRETPCGVAAITLHGRSRQQRYSRQADWDYISSTAKLIDNLNATADAESDTVREADERDQANAAAHGRRNKVFFLGNGDVYSHVDYYEHLERTPVDAVMVARGALIKPWIFEEIGAGQHLDKSSGERLRYVEQFVRSALMAWGSDEHGVGQTRRFLLEWLSFACRYVPIGLLEYLPPKINDRPPAYKGRDELETLMASDNYKDWIKISEMFLGPAHKDFRFEPKHKSNAYDTVEAEG